MAVTAIIGAVGGIAESVFGFLSEGEKTKQEEQRTKQSEQVTLQAKEVTSQTKIVSDSNNFISTNNLTGTLDTNRTNYNIVANTNAANVFISKNNNDTKIILQKDLFTHEENTEETAWQRTLTQKSWADAAKTESNLDWLTSVGQSEKAVAQTKKTGLYVGGGLGMLVVVVAIVIIIIKNKK